MYIDDHCVISWYIPVCLDLSGLKTFLSLRRCWRLEKVGNHCYSLYGFDWNCTDCDIEIDMNLNDDNVFPCLRVNNYVIDQLYPRRCSSFTVP